MTVTSARDLLAVIGNATVAELMEAQERLRLAGALPITLSAIQAEIEKARKSAPTK